MPNDTNCRARGHAIENLLAPILNAPRSATLLYGDSGIGKSTVLREAKRLISARENVCVGFYESVPGDPDPLLRALDDLLSGIYTVSGVADQIWIACQKLKNQLSLNSLKQFLQAVLARMGDSGGLGLFSKIALSAFGWVSEQAQKLDAKVPESFVPKLGVDVFRDMVKILQAALADRTFVLIIDNLSASAEAVTAEVRGFGSLDTLQGFLSRDFHNVQHLHFLFSWKQAQTTAASLQTFSEMCKEYGGRRVELGPIEAEDELANWLGQEFVWFRSLSDSEKLATIAVTGGLPEVVVRWRECEVSFHNPAQLKELANEVRERRYSDLQRSLESAPGPERKLLYMLALVPHAMTASCLEDMAQSSSQSCLDILRMWAGRDLLRRFQLDRQGSSYAYTFQHEKKRELVLDSLPQTFVDPGESLDRPAFNFFLSHYCSHATVHPFSDRYLGDALTLLSRSRLLGDKQGDKPLLELIYNWSEDSEAERKLPRWKFAAHWPRNLQALHFKIFLSKNEDLQEQSQVLETLEKWISEFTNAPMSLGTGAAEASSLPTLLALAGLSNRLDLAEALMEQLRSLGVNYPNQPGIARELATGLSYSALVCGSHAERARIAEVMTNDRSEAVLQRQCGLQLLGKVKSLLTELRDLLALFPHDATIAGELATGVLNATLNHGLVLGSEWDVGSMVDELRSLQQAFPHNSIIAEACAKGLMYSIRREEKGEQLERMVGELSALQGAFPQEPIIGGLLAKGLLTACREYADQGNSDWTQQVESAVSELRRLQETFPDQAVIAESLAGGLLHIPVEDDPQKQEALLDDLRKLWHAFPGEDELSGLVAGYMCKSAVAYCKTKQLRNADGLLAELRELRRDSPNNKTVLRYLCKALAEAVAAYVRLGQLERVEFLLGELRDLYQVNPTDGAPLAQALFEAAAALRDLQQVPKSKELEAELRNIVANDVTLWSKHQKHSPVRSPKKRNKK